MWVFPDAGEGLQSGERVEVTCRPMGYVRKRAAVLARVRRQERKRGAWASVHTATALGRARSQRCPVPTIKFYTHSLPIEPVKNMWEGRPRCAVCAGCKKEYCEQDHGFLWCPLAPLQDGRVKLVEEVRSVTEGCTKAPEGAVDQLLGAYQCDAQGNLANDDEEVLGEEDWQLEAAEIDLSTGPERAMGGAWTTRRREAAVRSWISQGHRMTREPGQVRRRVIEKMWGASREADWDGLLQVRNLRGEIHRRFAKHARVGGRSNWWAMNWSEMATAYAAALLDIDTGGMKKLLRGVRRKTDDWWQKAWADWRAAGMGLAFTNEVHRKGAALVVWEAVKCLLGDDFRDAEGRMLPPDRQVLGWSWVKIGQEARRWMTPEAKSVATERVLDDVATSEDVEALEQVGIRLWDMKGSDDTTTGGGGSAAGPQKRPWDDDSGQMRTAKEVSNDPQATEQQRQAARDWLDENNVGRKAPRAASTARGRRGIGGRGRARGRGRGAAGGRGSRGRAARQRGGGGQCLGGGQGSDEHYGLEAEEGTGPSAEMT